MSGALPFGWHRHDNGDVWSNATDKARPVLYRIIGGKWMVAGARTPAEMAAICALVADSASEEPEE